MESMILSSERKSALLGEVINPQKLPEAGFQSYEELKNNAASLKPAFLAGEILNPNFSYSKFYDLSKMDKGILALADACDVVDRIEFDPNKATAIRSSFEFRIAEMEFVKLLSRLDFLVNENGDVGQIKELHEQCRVLNERLYGKPDPEIVDAAKQAIWSNVESKTLSSSAQKIFDEISNGFVFHDSYVEPLSRPSNPEATLPDFNDESLAWAGEHILEVNADTEALIHEFWEEKVARHGTDYVCPPEDIVEALERVLALKDPNGTSGVRIFLDPEATALSWESPLMAVKVGGKRPAVESQEELFQKTLHELLVHGGRAINGLRTGLPVLGTGLFTDTPRPDYLTFEEGFATTVEEVVKGDQPLWDGSKLGHYLSIAMAEEGKDFRSVFETSWRYRLLMKIGSEEEVTAEMIEKEKSLTYTACVRVFRGTQTNIRDKARDVTPLTFNKDLAYLEGRVIAMRHIAELYESQDIAGLDRLFLAKYDPTNPLQNELVLAEFPS